MLTYSKIKSLFLFPNVIIPLGVITFLIYLFSYLFPFTDDAFVMNDVRPVAAQVTGFITHLYVKNGDAVKKDQVLFTVFNKLYEYRVSQLSADFKRAQAKRRVAQKMYDRDVKIAENHHKIFVKLKLDTEKYKKGYAIAAVSLMTLQNSEQDMQAAYDNWQAALKQVSLDKDKIQAQKRAVESLAARLKYAQTNLDLTVVRADANGIVQNLFLTLGAPVRINAPLFSLVYTDETYIQGNFNETDLRYVKKGTKVLIFPRMYLRRKWFHGEVVSDYWGANRQLLDQRTQLQNVVNENQWVLLPQRLPVLIKVTDPSPDFPLRVGMSAYVYLKV